MKRNFASNDEVVLNYEWAGRRIRYRKFMKKQTSSGKTGSQADRQTVRQAGGKGCSAC